MSGVQTLTIRTFLCFELEQIRGHNNIVTENPGNVPSLTTLGVQEHRGCPNIRHGYWWLTHQNCVLFITSHEENQLWRWRCLRTLRGGWNFLTWTPRQCRNRQYDMQVSLEIWKSSMCKYLKHVQFVKSNLSIRALSLNSEVLWMLPWASHFKLIVDKHPILCPV